jgi:hypothetical protein
MKKTLFKILAGLNKVVLPRYSHRDLTRLSPVAKVIIAFRYWVTKNSL